MFYRLLALLMIMPSLITANEGNQPPLIEGQTRNFTYRSLPADMKETVIEFITNSNKNPVNPEVSDPSKIVGNQLQRIANGNFYHLVTFQKKDLLSGVVIGGTMPKTGYTKGEHDSIIAKFEELLAVSSDSTPYGFSIIVPLFDSALTSEERGEIYQQMIKIHKNLASEGKTLPPKTDLIPGYLFVLLDPAHPDAASLPSQPEACLLTQLGFTNQGNFPKFYNKDRFLFTYPLF